MSARPGVCDDCARRRLVETTDNRSEGRQPIVRCTARTAADRSPWVRRVRSGRQQQPRLLEDSRQLQRQRHPGATTVSRSSRAGGSPRAMTGNVPRSVMSTRLVEASGAALDA